MKNTEVSNIKEIFAATGSLISIFRGAHEIKIDAVAVKSTDCPAITDAIDIVRLDLGVGFKAFSGRCVLRPGPQ